MPHRLLMLTVLSLALAAAPAATRADEKSDALLRFQRVASYHGTFSAGDTTIVIEFPDGKYRFTGVISKGTAKFPFDAVFTESEAVFGKFTVDGSEFSFAFSIAANDSDTLTFKTGETSLKLQREKKGKAAANPFDGAKPAAPNPFDNLKPPTVTTPALPSPTLNPPTTTPAPITPPTTSPAVASPQDAKDAAFAALQGSWHRGDITMTFTGDRIVTQVTAPEALQVQEIPGTFAIDGDFMVLSVKGQTTKGKYKVDGSTLTLDPATPGEVVLTRAALKLPVGEPAPAFTLKNQDDKDVSLGDFKGKWVVLYFYPKDDTPGCTLQACDFSDSMNDLERVNATVLGVSADSTESHRAFIKKHNLKITLLSDPKREVMTRYLSWAPATAEGRQALKVQRSTVIINPRREVAHHFALVTPKGHINELKIKLAELLRAWN